MYREICPSDIEQQEGRILRQGNKNERVKIFRYITENTFDAYSYQVIENKQKFISQIMTGKSPVRSCDDIDDAALTYAEVKALATGNPYIKQKMDLDIQVTKLKLLKANHTSQRYRLEDSITKNYPKEIAALKEKINGMEEDIRTAEANFPANPEQFFMKIGDKAYTDKKEAGTALVEICKEIKTAGAAATVGEYAGFKMMISFDVFENCFMMNLKGQLGHKHALGVDPLGNITRINHAVESMPKQLEEMQTKLANVEKQLETAKVEVLKPFAQEEELAEKMGRLAALNALLNMDEKGDNAADLDDDTPEEGGGQETSDRQEEEPDDYRVAQKPGQTESIFEKLEMETKVADASVPYPAEHEHMENHGNLQGLKPAAPTTDKPVQRVSIKERLAAFRLKAAEAKKQEKHKEIKRGEVL